MTKYTVKKIENELAGETAKQIFNKIRDLKESGEWDEMDPNLTQNEEKRSLQIMRVALRKIKKETEGLESYFHELWSERLIERNNLEGAYHTLQKWFEKNENGYIEVEELKIPFLIQCLPEP